MRGTDMTTRRHHTMPFGAELRADGTARFRLWAPSAKSVEICLVNVGEETRLPMPRDRDGWYESIQPARAGARYRFRIDGELPVPDPASRFQPDDVHGASELIDPAAFQWRDDE